MTKDYACVRSGWFFHFSLVSEKGKETLGGCEGR